MKKAKRFISLLLALLLCSGGMIAHADGEWYAALAGDDGGVPIDEAHFPDKTFRGYVSQSFDLDGNGLLSEAEIASATGIYLFYSGSVGSLEGLEYFTSLRHLECDYSTMTSLDLSKNTALVSLSCNLCRLTSLDVSHNPALESLHCSSNQLTSLDVSHNPALKDLGCNDNQLTSIDVSHNPALQYLSCTENDLTALDVSHNDALEVLYCGWNKLTNLVMGDHPALRVLDCSHNELTGLDLSRTPAMDCLSCDINRLTALDVSGCPALAGAVRDGKRRTLSAGYICTEYYTEGDPSDHDSAVLEYSENGEQHVLTAIFICDPSVTVTAGDLTVPGEPVPTPSPTPVPTGPISLSFTDDAKAVRVTGDRSGLFVRIALVLDMEGVSGLYVTQGSIDPDGMIILPTFEVPRLTVTAVNVSLVNSIRDIQKTKPLITAMIYRRLL